MPDWKSIVRERLNLNELSLEHQNETIAELANHLDELCEEHRAHGLSEAEALARTTSEVSDWRGLAMSIQRAKRKERNMNSRTKHFWLPGLAGIATVLLLQQLLRTTVARVGYEWAAGPFLFELTIWALGGSVGAFLSRQAGGERFARVPSGLFPVAVLLALTYENSRSSYWGWSQLAHWLPQFFVSRAAAVVLGALLFLKDRTPADSEVSRAQPT